MKNNQPKRILCLFDYKATTGFGNVSHNLVIQLGRHFGHLLFLDIVAINYFGEPGVEQQDQQTRVLVVTPGEIANDPFCRFTFLRLLENENYDGYFILQDIGIAIGMLPNLLEIDERRSQKGRKRLTGMLYFPVDSAPLSSFFEHEKSELFQDFADARLGQEYLKRLPRHRRSLGFFDRLIAYTEYGRSQVLSRAPWLKDKLTVIPHGINRNEFYPMDNADRHRWRQELFGEHAEKFIVINVNRNQYRKDIPKTIGAFRRWQQLVQSCADVQKEGFLYLHMHPDDPMGWDLRHVAEQLGLEEGKDYGFPPKEQWDAKASIETLLRIYNAADVFLTTTTGEGWGLTIHEAMACGCVVVAPNHTSITELGNLADPDTTHHRLEAVRSYLGFCATDDNVWREQVDIKEVADRLFAISERGRYQGTQQQAMAVTYARSLNWAQLGHQWKKEFENLFFT